MSCVPKAIALGAQGLSRAADAVGVVLLVWLGWRMFFVFDPALQDGALLVGLLGWLACWTDRGSRKGVPLLMLAYAGIGLGSAAVHRWTTVASESDPVWLSLFTPASHLAVMVAFIYGTAHLLRTPSRRAWFVVLLMASIYVLAAQIAFDRAAAGFVYVRGGQSLESVPHWSGIHGTSLFLTTGLPLALALVVTARSSSRVLAGALMATGLFVVAYLNGSRGGLVSMGLVTAAMGLFGVIGRSRFRSRPLIVSGAVTALSIGAAITLWLMRGRVEHGEELSGRTLMWEATARLALDHPWLGVGPGNYGQAIADSGHATEFIERYGGLHNAHNLFLQAGAEVGILGAICLLLFLLWAMRACWQAWTRDHTPVAALGLLFAVFGFLVHSASENFLESRVQVERTRLLVWMVLAAACALQRLPAHSGDEPA